MTVIMKKSVVLMIGDDADMTNASPNPKAKVLTQILSVLTAMASEQAGMRNQLGTIAVESVARTCYPDEDRCFSCRQSTHSNKHSD